MSESIVEDLRAIQEQAFASPLERYSAWKRLVEDPRAQSASPEERFKLYAGAASALGASPALKEPGGNSQLVALTRAAVESAPREGSLHGRAAIELSKVLARRAALSHEPSDWQGCLEHAEAMLRIVPQEDWRYPLYVLAEATVYYEFAVMSDDPDCGDRAIARLTDAKSKVRRGSGVFGTAAADLADICFRRHCQTGEIVLLELAIQSGLDFAATERPLRHERVLALRSLSSAFGQRFGLQGNPDDMVRAAASADEALEAATVAEQAEVHAIRGSAYRALFERTHDSSALDKALDSYSRALDPNDEEDNRDQRFMAVLLENYANCLASRHGMLKHDADLQRSVEISRKALGLLPTDDRFRDRGRMLRNLGVSLLELAQAKGDLQVLAEAEGTLREALTHVGPDDDQRGRVHLNLADVCFEAAARCPTRDRAHALERALAEIDTARDSLNRPWMRPTAYELGSIVADVAERQVGTLLCLSKIARPEDRARWKKRALWAGESAKASPLKHELLRTRAAPPPEVPDSAAESEQLLLADLARLETQELRYCGAESTDPLRIGRMLRRAELYSQLEDTWSYMASISAAAADYVAMRRGRPHDWIYESAALKPGCVCIAVIPFTDPPPAGVSSLGIDGLAKVGASGPRRLAIIATSAALSEPAIAISAGENPLTDAVHTFIRQVPIEAPWARRAETWHHALVPLIADLAAVAGPADELLISPSREGFSLPWHLVVDRAGWKTPNGRSVPVTTVPTLELVGSVRAQPGTLTRWHIATDARELGFDNPDGLSEAISIRSRVPVELADGPPVVIGDPLGDLRGARGEAEAVARVLEVKPLIEGDARSEKVLPALSEARVIHFATHARLNADEPLNSLIYLADRTVAVRDLLGLRSAAELIVLSACASSLGGNLRGEEIIGLADVLLRCGTREVIASLWRIDDEATGALMSKFHEYRPAAGSAAALAAAMSSIRRIPKWNDPYYWAGFILLATGDPACGWQKLHRADKGG